MRYIKNIMDLREALANGHCEFKIHLCGGYVYSNKHIIPCLDGRFGIVDYFDHSTQWFTARQLQLHCDIGKAMRQNAFTTE
ncbi:MAG TPA: hypothetical protein VHY30_11240 [Verrucomicrobiae bacterium]|jgi:hypothetical protein|nr:hypothetical protein [Verrucomicrobiae bacterium]